MAKRNRLVVIYTGCMLIALSLCVGDGSQRRVLPDGDIIEFEDVAGEMVQGVVTASDSSRSTAAGAVRLPGLTVICTH